MAAEAVRREWGKRTMLAYRGGAWAAEVLHWLVALGGDRDSIDGCHRLVADKLDHSRSCREVFLAAGGDPADLTVDLSQHVLHHGRGRPLDERVLLVAGEVLGCGETVALAMAREMRRGAREALVVRALDRAVADGERHAELGWTLLAERLAVSPEGRELVADRWREWGQTLVEKYAAGAGEGGGSSLGWGILPGDTLEKVVGRAVRETAARFRKLLAPARRGGRRRAGGGAGRR